jgi:hypothetical protein
MVQKFFQKLPFTVSRKLETIQPGPHFFRKGIDLVPVQNRSRQAGRRNTQKRTTRQGVKASGMSPFWTEANFLSSCLNKKREALEKRINK